MEAEGADRKKAENVSSEKAAEPRAERRRSSFGALYGKELADHLNGMRFYLIFGLLIVVSVASFFGAVSGIKSAASGSDGTTAAAATDFLFLKLFTTSGGSVYSFATFIAFLGPLAGITLGFDLINGERTQGTLNRLVAQPIYRDSVINAKFLAGSTAIFIIMLSLGLLMSGIGLIAMGVVPTGEEAARLLVYVIYATIYISFWMGVALFFSVLCRHAATSALASMAVWLYFSLFATLVSGAIAGLLYPTSDINGYANMLHNYSLTIGLDRLSPYYLFSEAAATILNPNIKTLNLISAATSSGSVSGYLSFGQSLLLVWPHLTAIIAMTLIIFAISYICFMRQEIRA